MLLQRRAQHDVLGVPLALAVVRKPLNLILRLGWRGAELCGSAVSGHEQLGKESAPNRMSRRERP